MATQAKPIPQEVADYLKLHHIITLATASFTGMPYANTVTYASDDYFIYFAAPAEAQLVRNVGDNHYVSFTIDDYTTDWRKARELQGVGRCTQATDEEADALRARFEDKFGQTVPVLEGVMYVTRPFEMHFVDFAYDQAARLLSETTSQSFEIADVSTLPNAAALFTNLDRTTFSAGEPILETGTKPSGRYFIVVDGEVELRGEGHGADQTVTRVGPGQLFGDHAAVSGHRGVLSAHATKDTVLLAVDRETVRDLTLPRPERAKETPPEEERN